MILTAECLEFKKKKNSFMGKNPKKPQHLKNSQKKINPQSQAEKEWLDKQCGAEKVLKKGEHVESIQGTKHFTD